MTPSARAMPLRCSMSVSTGSGQVDKIFRNLQINARNFLKTNLVLFNSLKTFDKLETSIETQKTKIDLTPKPQISEIVHSHKTTNKCFQKLVKRLQFRENFSYKKSISKNSGVPPAAGGDVGSNNPDSWPRARKKQNKSWRLPNICVEIIWFPFNFRFVVTACTSRSLE